MSIGNYQDHTKVSAIRYEHTDLSINDPIEFQPKGLWTPKIDPDNPAYASFI